jgi:hypothetical protein
MKLKTIYVGMTGGFGSLSQVLPLLERLDHTKYRVVCSISHGAAIAVQQLGYEFVPYPDVGQPTIVTPKGRAWEDLDQYWGRLGFADESYFTRLIEARLRLIDELQPDLLLTQFCPPTEVIARITGLPLICVTQSCWHPKGKPLCWWARPHVAGDYPRVAPVVNAVLERYGAEPITRMADLNTGDLTIIPSFPEFDPVADPGVHYAGPLSWESASRLASTTDSNMAALFAKPTVLVYTGHFRDSGGDSGLLILQHVVQALRNTGFSVLITTGLGQDLDDCRGIADSNIHVHQWVPITALIKRCQLFIHHGGHGSCMVGIANGVPSLTIPTFQEREFNARQLHLLGLGDFILPDELNVEVLRDKIEACLQNASLRENLTYWANELRERRYGGGADAAALVDQLIS